MGCLVLDLLPLTNKPDLKVVEAGLKKIHEEKSKITLSKKDLTNIFVEKCIVDAPNSFIEHRENYNKIIKLSDEMLSYISNERDSSNSPIMRDSLMWSFLDNWNYPYTVSQTVEAYNITISRLTFDSVKLENTMMNDSRYNLIMNNLPRANMSDVRELAKKLDMVIIPVEFSHPKVLFGEDRKLSDMFNMFNNNTEDDLYVMCPVNFYNHYRHLISKSEKEMFIPERFQSAFDALEMTRGTLSFILDKIDENSNEIVMINKRIDNLANRVDILENIERERREEQKRREMEFKYRNLDPMIINIPKDTNVNEYDRETKIHMLWGADLPDILLENKNLEVFKDNKYAYPEKIYDFIAKSDVFNMPQVRFKSAEDLVNRFYKNKSIEDVCYMYASYCDAIGSSYHSERGQIDIAAIQHSLKLIKERVHSDIKSMLNM